MDMPTLEGFGAFAGHHCKVFLASPDGNVKNPFRTYELSLKSWHEKKWTLIKPKVGSWD